MKIHQKTLGCLYSLKTPFIKSVINVCNLFLDFYRKDVYETTTKKSANLTIFLEFNMFCCHINHFLVTFYKECYK